MAELLETLIQLSAPLPAGTSRHLISTGNAGTEQTIQHMQRLVTTGKRDPRIRQIASRLIQSCQTKDYRCYAKAIFEYWRSNVKYAYDASGVEYLQAAHKTLAMKIGDCDDFAVGLSATLESIGIRCEFVTLRANPKAPEEYSHVYIRCFLPNGEKVAMDATMKHPFGWEPPEHFGRKAWPASLDATEDHDEAVMGLGNMRDYVQPNPFVCCSGMMAGLSFFGRCANPHACDCRECKHDTGRLSGLGVLSPSEVYDVISRVMDGRAATDLKAAKARGYDALDYTYNALEAAKKLPSPARDSVLPLAQSSRQAALDNMRAVQESINRYSDLVRAIQTASFGEVKPPQLSGLGLAPAVIIAIAGAAAVIAAATAWAYAESQRTGREQLVNERIKLQAQAMIDAAPALKAAGLSPAQIENVLAKIATPPASIGVAGELGGAALKIAIAALVGVGIYFFVKKRGGA